MYRFFLLLILTIQISTASATPKIETNIPEPLKPWVNWVLQNEDSYQCPFFYNSFKQKHCRWPGKLVLQLNSKKGSFESQWQIYKKSWVTLPGNKQVWPQNVTVDNKSYPVLIRQGKPSIQLPEGQHHIKGEFFWEQIPDNLAIPKEIGLFKLSIKGKTVPFPTIKNDLLWLKESDLGVKKPTIVENKINLQVFRKVTDTIPLQLSSFFEIEVSGNQREVSLPYALLQDFIPISLKSPLPARIEADGSLLVQVRPGRWQLEINARYPKPVTQLSLAIQDKQWPQSEIWSFNAMPYLRVIEITQLKSIDPSQTSLPRQWKSLPAYLIHQGEAMGFKVIRRGDPQPEPNQLSLKRQMWLDFDGGAYTVSDKISGKMTKGWRLNSLPEMQLGQVQLNGQNQLITTEVETNKAGIEVRKGNLQLQADSRIKGDISQLSAVGWEQNFHQVQTKLNIPPGWRVLAVSGVDNDPKSWLSQWTLLDLFLVLIAALAISRLWSIPWGVFALISLAVIWHEAHAPQFIWLNILAAIALIRVIPEGKFQKLLKWYRNLCWLSLVIIVIPFMVSQIRMGLYPQLEKQRRNISSVPYAQVDSLANYAEQGMVATDQIRSKPLAKMRSMASPSSMPMAVMESKRQLKQIDPDANIQTGPGLPQWNWNKIHLSWNGSVDSQQQLHLWYLSPTQTMILNFLQVILVLVLSLLMFGLMNKKWQLPKGFFSWFLLIPILSLPVEDASANFPNQQILSELKKRLLKAPDCLPNCAQIASMDLSITEKLLNITMQVHAQQAVAIPLPAKLEQWFPNQVLVNGDLAQGLIRTNKNTLWVSISKGVHVINLQGINPVKNKFFLPLSLNPHQTSINAQGWLIEGVHKNGRTDNQLVFSRIKTDLHTQADKQQLQPGDSPAFIRVERTLSLGLDWRIKTRVVRVFNNGSAISLAIPLIKNESVTSDRIKVKDKQVLINMSSQQNSVQWQSVLKKTAQIELIATDTPDWTEVWRADVSSIWHIESSGISVVHHQDRGRWLPEWRPWPGEKVSLMITRPLAVKGATLTIDRTDLLIKPGKRSLESELKISLRSSKGGQHTLTLPEQIELQTVKINGQTQPIRLKQSQIVLPIKPGKQDISLRWRNSQQQETLLTTANINLGIASVNNHLNLKLGRDRWVLFTSGPKFGPAVLFWGVLIVIAAISVGLGKLSFTPLKHWHWFLLLIGLSQIPITSALIVVAWLLALGIRAKKYTTESRYFNLIQITLGMLTFVSLILLFVAVQHGLLGSPDMQIVGNQSSAFNLNWYQDRSDGVLPTATIISVPLMAYRILMLLWSLWLAVSLLNWLKWGWGCFSTGGLWKEGKSNKKPVLENTEK